MSTTPELTGRLIAGRYRVKARVGAGGMGVVWLGHDERLNRAVAIKVLLRQDEPHVVERFKREAQATAALVDPRIVTVHDVGDDDGAPYIVMELLVGHTLRHELRTRGRMPWRVAVAVVLEIARGLDVAHRAGIVHRDLKPENVFLVDGRRDRIKIVDFGLARVAAADVRDTGGEGALFPERLTQAGVFVGTPGYAAPECALSGAADARSDLYALGVIAFELLTGHEPFSAATPAALVLKHVTEPAPAPSTSTPDIPAAVDALLARLLAKDPAARPRSGAAIVLELENGVEDTDPGSTDALVRATPSIPTPSQPAASASSPRPPTSVAITAAPGAAPPVRRRAALLALAVVVVVAAAATAVWVVGRDALSAGDAASTTAIATPVLAFTGYVNTLTLTADGKHLAYGDRGHIIELDLESGGQTALALPDDGRLVRFDYGPAGEGLVAHRYSDGTTTLSLVDLKSGSATPLAADMWSSFPSPDRTRVAIASARGVWIADVAGRDLGTVLDPIASGRRSVIGWSDDDDLLIIDDNGAAHLVAAKPATPSAAQRVRDLPPELGQAIGVIGRHLLFSQRVKPAALQLVATTVDRIERAPEVVSPPFESATWITAAAAGRRLVVAVATRQDHFRVAELRDDGRSVSTFTALPGGSGKSQAAFGPDGALYFNTHRTGGSRIYAQQPASSEVKLVATAGEWAGFATFAGESLVYWCGPTEGPDAGVAVARLMIHAAGGDRELFRDDAGRGGAIVRCGRTVCVLAKVRDASLFLVGIDTKTAAKRPIAAMPFDASEVGKSSGMSVSADDKTVAVLTGSGDIAFVDVATGKSHVRTRPGGWSLASIVYLPSGALLATRAPLATAALVRIPADDSEPPTVVLDEADTGGTRLHDVSKDGRLVVEGLGAPSVHVYTLSDGPLGLR